MVSQNIYLPAFFTLKTHIELGSSGLRIPPCLIDTFSSDLFAHLSGKVLSINDEIENAPDLVNSDPYKKGWLIKISPSQSEEKKDLMNLLKPS